MKRPTIKQSREDNAALAAIETVEATLLSIRPTRDGSLEGVNAHWQWRNAAGAFRDALRAQYPRVFSVQDFNRATNFYGDGSYRASKAI